MFYTDAKKFGSVERGKTIFEGLVTSYKKRLDIWNVYFDVCVKHYSVKQMRAMFRRSCGVGEEGSGVNLKAFKMKYFFKKWLEYEQRHGDVAGQEEVTNAARAFVEKEE